MLGWRYESDRSCRVMVRLTEDRGDKTAWAADLEQDRMWAEPEDERERADAPAAARSA
jgi:hypothetical protein